jgi:hypothetical protein
MGKQQAVFLLTIIIRKGHQATQVPNLHNLNPTRNWVCALKCFYKGFRVAPELCEEIISK